MLNLLILLLFPYIGCNDLDVIIIADYSASIQGNEKFIHGAISAFEKKLDISEDNIHLGVIVFNVSPEVLCPLQGDPYEIKDRIALLDTYTGYSTTNLRAAFYSAFDEFGVRGRDMHYKKIIIIISDGQPDHPETTKEIARQVKLSGIQVFTILIDNNIANSEYMKEIASDNCFYNTDYQGLIKTLGELNLCL